MPQNRRPRENCSGRSSGKMACTVEYEGGFGMVLSPFPRSGTHGAGEWASEAPDTFWTRWFGGVILPLALVASGIACLLTRTAVLFGWRGVLFVQGLTAAVVGIACFAAAAFLHIHCYWHPRLAHPGIAQIGEIAALLVFLAAAVTVIVRVVAYP